VVEQFSSFPVGQQGMCRWQCIGVPAAAIGAVASASEQISVALHVMQSTNVNKKRIRR
jgi:hypothetical protein